MCVCVCVCVLCVYLTWGIVISNLKVEPYNKNTWVFKWISMYSMPIYYEHYICVYHIVRIYCGSSNFINSIWNTLAQSKLHTFLVCVFRSGRNIQKLQKLFDSQKFFSHNKFPLVNVVLVTY